ncbi:MAG: hypothetical protein PUB45_02305 [Bacteroidales bacterium]|nr:hypothetical protein [Bacteroidales bacterium]MDY3783872.1 hypothetical protein [Candidatus Cryptobacteroides sp.]
MKKGLLFQTFLNVLGTIGSIGSIQSTFVMNEIKQNYSLNF